MGNPFSMLSYTANQKYAPNVTVREFPKNKCLMKIESCEKMFIEDNDKTPFARQMITCRIDAIHCALVTWQNVCEDISQMIALHDPRMKYDFWIHNNHELRLSDADKDAKFVERAKERRADIEKEMDYFERMVKKSTTHFTIFFIANEHDPGFSLHFSWRGNEFARMLTQHCNQLITTNTHLDLKDYFPDEKVRQIDLTSSSTSDSDTDEKNSGK